MNYSAIAAKINTIMNEVNQLLKSIETITFDETWKGNTHDKLTTDLKDTISKFNIQIANITNFANNLNNLETYKTRKEQHKNLLGEYNSATQESIRSDIKIKLESLDAELTSLRNSIKSALNYQSISAKQELVTYKTPEQPLINKDDPNIDSSRILKDATIIPDPEPVKYIDGKPEGLYKNKAKELVLYYDGKRIAADSVLNVKVGETIKINVKLPEDCGKVNYLTRTSADGQDNWKNYISAYSEPFVDRNDSSTAVAVESFDWVITPKQKSSSPITLSETTFHSTDYKQEVKSMVRIKINITE